MSRPLRIKFPGAYYHLMNRGLARQEIFTDRFDREAFLKRVAESHQVWRLRVIAYCLMDNHYHLLVQTPEANLCRRYLQESKPAWLDVDQLLGRFSQKEARAAFLTFMRSEVEAPVKSFYKRAQWLPKRQPDTKEVPQAREYVQPNIGACFQAVMRVYGKSEGDLKRSRHGEQNEARAIAIYVCRKSVGMKQEQIDKGGVIVSHYRRIQQLLQR